MTSRTARRILPSRLGVSPYISSIAHETAPHLQRRPFFSLPGSGSVSTQHLSATRVLPYALPPVYKLIADVDSYSSFLPYCSSSPVTRWSEPDAQGQRWPIEADLHVGWGGFDEVFSSRLRCVPDQSVEAVSGGGDKDASAVFKSLVTRWSVRALDQDKVHPRTQVHLDIRYQFTNPLYAAVSAAVSDKVAGLMIEAFETRAKQKLGKKLYS